MSGSQQRRQPPAPHTDVEALAKKLDKTAEAARDVGVHLVHVEAASDMLRYLSDLLHGTQKALDEARAAKM